jgi:hypothetical protein
MYLYRNIAIRRQSMNYANQPTPENDNSVEVKEPVAAYYTGTMGNAAAEPYETNPDDDDFDFGAPESVTAHSYEELRQKLEEGLADIEAGREYTWEEVRRELRQEFFNESV